MSRRVTLAKHCATAAVLLVTSRAAAQGAAEDNVPNDAVPKDAVRELVDEAARAHAAGDFETCAGKATIAYRTDPDSGILGLLGVCELELGRTRDAAAHLDAFLREYRGDRSEAVKQASEAFQRATAEVATFDVQTKPAGATLELDGKAVGKAPTKIFVEPGSAQLVARLEGYQDAERALDAVAGEDVAVELVLEAAPGGAAPPGGDAGDGSRPAWPLFVFGGVAVVGVGVGITGLVLAGGARSDVEEFTPGPEGCNETCLDDRLVDVATFDSVGAVGFIGAGAALATGIVLHFVLPRGRGSTIDQTGMWSLWVAPTGAGAVAGGTF